MERLLRAGVDVCCIDTPQTRNSPLHWAATFGNAVTVQILLEQFGADPNVQNSSLMTPLHDSVTRGNLDIVRVLVKFGADPTLKSNKDQTPMDLAASKNLSDILKVLKSSSYLHNGNSAENGTETQVCFKRIFSHFQPFYYLNKSSRQCF